MPPQTYMTLDTNGDTTLNLVVFILLSVGIVLLWRLPRRRILLPVIFLGILIPTQQQIVLAGLNITGLRILLLCAWLRILPDIVRERRLLHGPLTRLDKALASWILGTAVIYTVQWSSFGSFVNRMGLLYTVLGIYFLFRHLVRTPEDVHSLVKAFAAVCAIIAVLMVIEQVTQHNPLSSLGANPVSEMRYGRLRSQGPFQHPIIAGTCAATLIPVFFGEWWSRRSRTWGIVGILSATVMALTSSSSTPLMAYIVGLCALCMWRLRGQMRRVRWILVFVLICLHLVMKAPVWALIGRVRLLSGSTSWQRFELVNQFINRFGEWWFLGTRTNAQWGQDMWDTVNWYVAAGVSGGILGLVLFIAILVYGFKGVGRALRSSTDQNDRRLCWSLGAALFANCVAFLGIAYFDQSIIFWYGLLAMIPACAHVSKRTAVEAPICVSEWDATPVPDSSVALQ